MRPLLRAHPGGEAQAIGRGLRRAVEIGEQLRLGLVIGEIVAAIDQPVADPVLQRNAPLPAGGVRGGAGVGGELPFRGARHSDRAVAGEPVAPVLERRRQFLPEQQAAKAAAIDDEIARDPAPVLQRNRSDVAAFAIALDRGDLAFDPRRAARFGQAAQVGGVETGVEVVRPRHVGHAVPGITAPHLHLERARRALVERIGGEFLGHAQLEAAQPQLVEGEQACARADLAEGVHVAGTRMRPADEFDAQLEGGFGLAQKLCFVDPQRLVEQADLRDRCLAYADRADRFGLDQRDRAWRQPRERRRRHPPGGAARSSSCSRICSRAGGAAADDNDGGRFGFAGTGPVHAHLPSSPARRAHGKN